VEEFYMPPRLTLSTTRSWTFALVTSLLVSATGVAWADDTALPPETVIVTNQKYNHGCFWAAPKGIAYGELPNAQPIQKPPAYPDGASTYFVAWFSLPEGAHLRLESDYPHERYFSHTIAATLSSDTLGGGDFLRDDQIEPDAGSINPFRTDQPRDGSPRSYTVRILSGPVPSDGRAPNTIYTLTDDPDASLHLAMRNYVADTGYDGTGNARLEQVRVDGLPEVTLVLADGSELTGQEMCDAVGAKHPAESPGYEVRPWDELVKGSDDPENAPAQPTPVWELFWNTPYSITGMFTPDPATRVANFPVDDSGGFLNNPDTRYVTSTFSLGFGPVIVVRGKMPTFPPTHQGNTAWLPDTEVRYWSACMGAAPPSGAGWDCVFDESTPVDDEGMYTLVVSRPENRPSNAREECGFTWVNFGQGEGDYTGARPWVGFMYLRYMTPNADWAESPNRVPAPTPTNPYPQEAYVMKEYLPRAHYETREEFESHGCPGH
jgi:hypothetical protein